MKSILLVTALVALAAADDYNNRYINPTTYTQDYTSQSSALSRPPNYQGSAFGQTGSFGSYPTTQPQYQVQTGYLGSSAQYPSGYGQYSNQIPIVRLDNNPNAGDGAYGYAYETNNGISVQEEGRGGVGVQGGYSYTSPEGKQIVVRYTADEYGFHPEGDHIPTPSAAILKSIELNKAQEARRGYQDKQYDDGYSSGGYVQQYGTPTRGYEGFRPQYAASPQGIVSGSYRFGDQRQEFDGRYQQGSNYLDSGAAGGRGSYK